MLLFVIFASSSPCYKDERAEILDFCSNFVKAQEKIFPDLENCEFITGTTKSHILRSVHLSHNKL